MRQLLCSERAGSLMELRFLTQDDAQAFRDLRLAAMKERPTAFSADYQANLQRPLGDFAAQIHSLPDNFILGAFQNGSLNGIVGFFRSEGPKVRHNGNIWSMYVKPELRGQGVISLLFCRFYPLSCRKVNLLGTLIDDSW
jgi:GNAT superfamily N-acetyltransferase